MTRSALVALAVIGVILVGAAPEADKVEGFYKRVWTLTQNGDKAENPIQGPGRVAAVDVASFQVVWMAHGGTEVAYLRHVLLRDVVGVDIPTLDDLPAVVYYTGPNGIEWARLPLGKSGSEDAMRFDKLLAQWVALDARKARQ